MASAGVGDAGVGSANQGGVQGVSGGLFLRLSRPSEVLNEASETLGRILALGSLGMIMLACATGYFLADQALPAHP